MDAHGVLLMNSRVRNPEARQRVRSLPCTTEHDAGWLQCRAQVCGATMTAPHGFQGIPHAVQGTMPEGRLAQDATLAANGGRSTTSPT